jgi:hypothetical protein
MVSSAGNECKVSGGLCAWLNPDVGVFLLRIMIASPVSRL